MTANSKVNVLNHLKKNVFFIGIFVFPAVLLIGIITGRHVNLIVLNERKNPKSGHSLSEFICLFGFLTSSLTTRLYRGRAPGS